MASTEATIQKLRGFGLRSPANLTMLETWLDASIIAQNENDGGQIVSASTNGASFARGQGLTIDEWSNAIHRALQMIEYGVKSNSRSGGWIR